MVGRCRKYVGSMEEVCEMVGEHEEATLGLHRYSQLPNSELLLTAGSGLGSSGREGGYS